VEQEKINNMKEIIEDSIGLFLIFAFAYFLLMLGSILGLS